MDIALIMEALIALLTGEDPRASLIADLKRRVREIEEHNEQTTN